LFDPGFRRRPAFGRESKDEGEAGAPCSTIGTKTVSSAPTSPGRSKTCF
jgi:hypothetical protein